MNHQHSPPGVYARFRDTPERADDELVVCGIASVTAAQRFYAEYVQDQIGAWLIVFTVGEDRYRQAINDGRLPPIRTELRLYDDPRPDVHWPYQTARERWDGLSEVERTTVHKHTLKSGRLVRAAKGALNDPWLRAEHHGTIPRLLGPTVVASRKARALRGQGARG